MCKKFLLMQKSRSSNERERTWSFKYFTIQQHFPLHRVLLCTSIKMTQAGKIIETQKGKVIKYVLLYIYYYKYIHYDNSVTITMLQYYYNTFYILHYHKKFLKWFKKVFRSKIKKVPYLILKSPIPQNG